MFVQKKNSRVKINLKKKKNMILNYGSYGFKILKPVELNEKHIEIMINIIKKLTNKKAKIKTTLVFNKIKTKKPDQIRMGKGKGNISEKVSQLIPGRIFLEMNNISKKQALICISKIQKKFHVCIKLITL